MRRWGYLAYADKHLNVLVTGAFDVGKTLIADACTHAVCRADCGVRSFRMQRLTEELARYREKKLSRAYIIAGA